MRTLFSLLILLLVIGAIYLFWGAEDYLSRYLTRQLGTTVEIEKVGVGTSSFSLKKLTVLNPRPAKSPTAFSANRIELIAPWSSFFKRSIHVESLQIDTPRMSIEFYNSSGSSNNWVQILKNMPISTEGRPLKIDKLILLNIEFEVMKANGRKISLPTIPYLEIRDLGTLSTTEIAQKVFQQLLVRAAKEAALSKILNALPPAPTSSPKEGKAEKWLERLIGDNTCGLIDP
ncbi:MAG: hypothetical protein K0U13_01635 [Chlamydiae bacterium]|nr:hypothetical protein [Chlamydiales bacterium]MCH9703471.1 hypothetical protein [Chlamydiota bacterium]